MTRVDYDEAVLAYEASLTTQLRRFGRDLPSFLALFVPDADPSRGVASMLDAAAAEGAAVTIAIGPETAARLDRAALASRPGVHVRRGGLGLEVTFVPAASAPVSVSESNEEFLAKTQSSKEGSTTGAGSAPVSVSESVSESDSVSDSDSVSVSDSDAAGCPPPDPLAEGGGAERASDSVPELAPAFHGNAHRYAERPRRALPAEPRLAVPALGGTLAIVVCDGLVDDAGHEGAEGFAAGVLEAFCEAVIGLSIEEACQHGAHHAMEALRDPTAPPPVPGVLTPRSASPMLAELLEAGHALARAHTAPLPDSERGPALDPGWIDASDEERLARVRAAWDDACADAALDAGDVRLVEIRKTNCVIVELADALDAPARRRGLLALEAALRRRVEPGLVLERGARRDLNVLRRR